MNTTTQPAVAEYIARVKAELADLPAAEVEEIVEDIEQHLGEVASELGDLGDDVSVEALSARLGTPEEYASELRTAAGYPAGEPVAAPRLSWFLPRIALWALVIGVVVTFTGGLAYLNDGDRVVGPVLVLLIPLYAAITLIFTGIVKPEAVAGLPEYRAGRRVAGALSERAVSYLRSLRPAWWLLRIVVLVAGALLALDRKLGGSFLLVAIALVIVVWVGARAREDQRWRWVVAPANFFTVGLLIAVVGTTWGILTNDGDRPGVIHSFPEHGLINDGGYIENIYLFGPDGKPLPEAYLYDHNGKPIFLVQEACSGSDYSKTNKVPLSRVEDTGGTCYEVSGVPFTVVLPTPPK